MSIPYIPEREETQILILTEREVKDPKKEKRKGKEWNGMERKGTESVGATNTGKNFARCQNARGKRQVYKGESLRPQLYGRLQ